MKLNKIMVIAVMVVTGLIALVFIADLAIAQPFGRWGLWTDLAVVTSCGLILWQAVETLLEFKPKKK